jgi:hypothetical protein
MYSLRSVMVANRKSGAIHQSDPGTHCTHVHHDKLLIGMADTNTQAFVRDND